jgi:hypothetical protein
MSRVVHLHIGAPKTGTTYLQDRLRLNEQSLASHGVLVPGPRVGRSDTFHFRAALDVLGRDWGGRPGHAKGAWPSLVRKVARARSSAIVSHEILAPAPGEVVRRIVDDLDGDVHVVYSARDLARQLPAAWQESIKQGRRWKFSTFLNKYQRGSTWFHRALDLPGVLSTWGEHVPADRITLVTVPHDRGPSGDLLWQRFCTAFDLDPAWLPVDSDRSNASLGTAETQILRRLNKQLDLPMWREPAYDELIRELLAHQVLVNRRMTPVRLPPDRYDWVEGEAERWSEWVRQSGIRVVGDVDDLRPRRPDPEQRWRDPDAVRAKKQLDAALDALVAVTREAAERHDPDGGRVSRVVRTLRRT